MVCMRHLLFLFMRDLILIRGKIKSARYGLLTELALLVKCLAPGQNCIACIICLKCDLHFKIARVSTLLLLYAVARGVKEKERIFFIVHLLMRCKQKL